MGSESTIRLPILNLSSLEKLIPGTPEWESRKVEVMKALQEYGCFEASCDFPIDIREKMFNEIAKLFDLPAETKILNPYRDQFTHPRLPVPLFETIKIKDSNILEAMTRFTNTMWPNGNDTFCKILQSFANVLMDYDMKFKRMVMESLGVDKYFNEHIDSSCYSVRINKYDIQTETEIDEISQHAHTDKCFTTILYDNQVSALEVKTKDGEWINVDISPNSFIYMIGDSLSAWTNGRLEAPLHRVRIKRIATRYFIGLFSFPIGGYVVKAPEELIDEDRPMVCKPFKYDEFIHSIVEI